MKKFLILFLFCAAVSIGMLKAQSSFFLYLQSQNNEPFSVNINNTLYHADNNGYVIISKLKRGNVFFKVLFPLNKYPMHHFAIDVQNDFGFLLQPIDSVSWQLASFQGLGNITSGKLLASNTPKYHEQVAATSSAVSSTLIDSDTTHQTTKTSKTKQPTTPVRTVIRPSEKISKEKEFMASEGLLQQYIDASSTTKDTIQLLILNNVKPELAKPIVKKTTYDKPCTIASMDEFLKVRLRMAAATSEEGMLDAAKEWLVLYCFSTEQVKNLSVLFLTQANKLRFFGIALPRIYDANNVTGLQSQFTDQLFIQQFKLLIQ